MELSRKKASILNIGFALVNQFVLVVYGLLIPNLILNTFGAKLHGYTSTVNIVINYMGLLNAGLVPVAVQAMYAPLAKKDTRGTSAVFNAVDRFFFKAGIYYIIAVIGASIALPFITRGEVPTYEAFGLMLAMGATNTLDCFLYSKYLTILQADQRLFVVSWVDTGANVLRLILQCMLIFTHQDIIVVMAVPALLLVFRSIILNRYCKKHYPYIDRKVEPNFDSMSQRRDSVYKKIAWLITSNTDMFILACVGNLIQVSIYSVYNMIFSQLYNVIVIFSNGILASFGQLIAEDKKEQAARAYNIYEFLFCGLAGFIFSVTASVLLPFVSIYTKKQVDIPYVDATLAILFITNEFFRYLKLPCETLINAKGHFRETRTSAIVEASINLIVSLILLKPFGMYGLLIGSIVSNIYITLYTVLYAHKHVIEKPVAKSILRLLRTAAIIVLNAVIYRYLFNIYIMTSWLDWIKYAVITSIISLIVVGIISFATEPGMIKKCLGVVMNKGSKIKAKSANDKAEANA